jgi:hypothetical protein
LESLENFGKSQLLVLFTQGQNNVEMMSELVLSGFLLRQQQLLLREKILKINVPMLTPVWRPLGLFEF